jgi:uncharacterized protein (TIGR03067 family)
MQPALLLLALAADPAPANEFTKLAGLWKPVSVRYDGQERFPEGKTRDDFTLVIRDGEYRLYFAKDRAKDEHVRLATAALTLTASTRTFEMTISDGPRKGQRLHGIYELKDGKLSVCYGPADRPMPTGFDAPPGSLLFSEVWKRDR